MTTGEIILSAVFAAYAAACVVIHLSLRAKWKRGPFVFPAPKSRAVYYLLSFTWGLPVTLGGCVVALALVVTGHRPRRYGWDWCFDLEVDWGLDMGLFFIADSGGSRRLHDHEHGHTLQNIRLGPFMPFVVCLPSTVRFWHRHLAEKRGKYPKTHYDSVWFEGSATLSGKALTDKIGGYAPPGEERRKQVRRRRNAKMRFRAAIFDMDGTLIDSMGVWKRIDETFLTKRGIAVPADYAESICALGFRGTAEYTVKRFGLSDTPEDLMREWSEMADEEYAKRIFLFPGAKDYLLKLKNAGVMLCIATALTEKMYLPCLKNNGVDGLFDHFFAVDVMHKSKSEPAFFEEVSRAIGVPAGDCVVFDDVTSALRAAQTAGMKVCGVAEATSAHREEEIRSFADRFIESFGDAPLPGGGRIWKKR